MKEYLERQIDGSYKLIESASGEHDWFEVPQGAIKAFKNGSGSLNFINSDDDYMNSMTNGLWIDTHRGRHESSGHELVWQRPQQPEELPFIDDEPKDNVNHPQHYTSGDIECIDAIKASMSEEAFKGFLKGNVLKYMWRYEHKGGKESLEKAQWYLNKLISLV